MTDALPDAARTGNLTLRPYAIVDRLLYDAGTNKIKGVHVTDAETGEKGEYYARLVFLNASTLGSTQILLHSATREYPDGLANSSGVLGHYLMDHHAAVGAVGGYSGLQDTFYHGQRPASVYIPRFRNVRQHDQDYVRGFSFESRQRLGHRGVAQGASGAKPRRLCPGAAVRAGPWKLIEFFEDAHVELYHLHEDVGETNDLAPTQSEKVRELQTMLHAWQQAVDARFSSPNPACGNQLSSFSSA